MARRILLLITDLEIGGTPTVVRELAVRLNDPGRVEVEVACLSRWGPVVDQIRSAGVPVTPLDAGSVFVMPWIVARLARLVRSGRFDTVFSFLVHANAVAAAACGLLRSAGHGVQLLQSVQTTQPRPRWHWRVQEWAAGAAERIVVPSPSVADVARRWAGVPPARIAVIPNAIDVDEFPLSPVPATSPRPYPVGFLGRLDPIKRVPDLLQAVAALSGLVELHVFGDGPEHGRIAAEIDRLSLGRLVRLHGSVSRPQEALGQVGLLVLPSAAEGFGLVLIEAMASGVPVVATDVAGIRDVVRDGLTGLLVPPAQPAALAAAIGRVVRDPELRRSLAAAAAEDVRARFSWQSVLRQYHSVLQLADE